MRNSWLLRFHLLLLEMLGRKSMVSWCEDRSCVSFNKIRTNIRGVWRLMLTQKSMAFLAMEHLHLSGASQQLWGLSFFSRKLVRSKGTPSWVWAKFTRGITTDRPKNREMEMNMAHTMRIKLPLGHPKKWGLVSPKWPKQSRFEPILMSDEYIWYTVDRHIWQSLNEFQTAFESQQTSED